MKSYREIADSVFARREQYVIAQRKKKQLVTRVTASVGSVALVSLAGIALLRSDAFRETPPLSDGGATTTTTHIPTEKDSTTTTTASTTASTASTTTDGGIVTPPTTAPTTAPSKTEPPKTTPSKTEPSKTNPTTTQTKPTATQTKPTVTQTQPTTLPTTTPTVPQKIVITADEPDTYGDVANSMLSRDEKYISPALQEKMKLYENKDVVYSVIAEIALTIEDYEDCDNYASTNEEVIRLAAESAAAYDAFLKAKEQAGGWTQDVIEKYHIHKELSSQHTSLYDKLAREYIGVIRNRRTIELSSVSNNALISLATDTRFIPFFAYDSNYAFFMELTADQIEEVAERGGYVIRLVFPDGDQPMDLPE